MEPTIDRLHQALIKADAAGDIESAKVLAAEIRKRGTTPTGPDPKAVPAKVGREAWPDILRGELQSRPAEAKIAAAGTALSDLWQGGKQLFGIGDKQAIEDNKIIASENPISAVAGNVALGGAMGAAAPILNSARGATAGGALLGLLQPTDMDNVAGGKVLNAALGGAAGFAGNRLSTAVGNSINNARTAAATRAAQNAPRDATLAAAREAGYVVTPTAANPSWINRTLESLSGKEATRQAASVRNQEVTNRLVRQALGMTDDTPITGETLDALRHQLAQPYREVAALGDPQAEALQQLRQARSDATGYFRYFNRSGDPAAQNTARQFQTQADGLEGQLESFAQSAGQPDLIDALRTSRRQIARTHNVERALNDSTGNVDARNLSRQMNNGAPLSDELETAARFASAFPNANKTPEAIGGDGVSKLKFALSALLGTSGAATGGPVGAAAGALPFVAPEITRSVMLSAPYQAAMATPRYGIGPTRALAEALLASRYSPMAITGGAVPALSQ